MKKYVHVWFVILATLLSILFCTTTQAHPHSAKVQKQQITKQKSKQKQYVVREERTVYKAQRKKVKTRDPIETLIANEFRESKMIQQGKASWYGPGFYGRKTASGEVFTKTELTAAHRTLPMGTKLRVTNKDTGESVVVKVNDRGPFHGNRVIDLSHAAAKTIGMIKSGVCSVKIERII